MIEQALALFFTKPLQAQDWGNLDVSHVRQVMLPFEPAVATDDTLRQLKQRGVGVVMRIFPERFTNMGPGEAQGEMLHFKSLCDLRAVFIDNEPDGRVPDLSWHANTNPGWMIDYLYQQYLPHFRTFVQALSGHGVKLISPGLTQRDFTELSPAQPGQFRWVEAARSVWDHLDGNGVHIYGYGWPNLGGPHPEHYGSSIDAFRFMFQVRQWTALYGQQLWIDEVNIENNSHDFPIPQVQRMQACMEMARLLRSKPDLGGRVEFFCPFVSSGYRNGTYPEGFIMDDPSCYPQVARFMAGN